MDPAKIAEMMKQAQQMQSKMQDDLRNKSVEGQAGGGMVKVVVNGLGEVTNLSIDKAVVDPEDVGMLEDLVRAAMNSAVARIEEVRMEQARGMAGNLGFPPGMV